MTHNMNHNNAFGPNHVGDRENQQQEQHRERLPSFLISGSNNASIPQSPLPSNYNQNTYVRPPSNTASAVTTPADSDSFEDTRGPNLWPFPNQNQHQQPRRHGNNLNTPSNARQMSAGIAFNDRLRTDIPDIVYTMHSDSNNNSMNVTSSTETRTPSRLPPSKSLLDSGPPSVMQLRPPSTPGSFARPPIHSSYNQTPSSQTPRFPSTPSMTPGTLMPSASFDPNSSSASPGVANQNTRWITIFGFGGADMESQAIREFRRHGDIVRTVAGKGNWVHVLYRTPLQAQVALYRSWRILAGTDVMIGAVPCTEPDLAKDEDEGVERGFLVASPATHLHHMSTSPGRHFDKSPQSAARMKSPAGTGLRAPSDVLRTGNVGGNRSGGVVTEATQTIVQTPQKQTGILEYFTGFYK